MTNEKKWYAIYTRSRGEKKLAIELEYAGIEHFLPLVKRLKQWSDRKKLVDEPLFRCYVFVRITESDFFKVTNLPYAMRFVKFEGKPVEIPSNQIMAIRHYLKDPEPDETHTYDLHEGQLVRVKSGTMEGIIGRLVQVRNQFRLVVLIDALGKTIRLNIPRSRVEPVNEN
ncbi:MAG TPA: UpxY family transcription antiterminator [Bacteroidales bacterium]|nr:UpxY family transcription antiterminator [Bacteroidales bacterium]